MGRITSVAIGLLLLSGCGCLTAPTLTEARNSCAVFSAAVGDPLTDDMWEALVTMIQMFRDMGLPKDQASLMSLMCAEGDVPMAAMAECRQCLNDLVDAVYCSP
jgi:hypothetical protein